MSDDGLTLTLMHDDEAARDRFYGLDMPKHDRDEAVLGGWRVAEQRSVAVVMQGRYGLTDEAIESSISLTCGDDLRSLRRQGIAREYRYAYGVGFKSRMRHAKAEFLTGLAAIEKATEALEKLADGLNAASELLTLTHGIKPNAPPSHALALGRRPLRPEDFDAFPTPPSA